MIICTDAKLARIKAACLLSIQEDPENFQAEDILTIINRLELAENAMCSDKDLNVVQAWLEASGNE